MSITCPTCGCPVKVVSDPFGEGTNHYEPIAGYTIGQCVEQSNQAFKDGVTFARDQEYKLKEAVRELIEWIEEISRLSKPSNRKAKMPELDRFRKLTKF